MTARPDRDGRVHGTCVAVANLGVLIRGASGAGKSDLALRLIDGGARLVADDQVLLARDGGRLVASSPASIRGRMEVRGLGIVAFPPAGPTPLALVVDLAEADEIARLPESQELAAELLGVKLPRLRIDAAGASAAARVRAALAHLGKSVERASVLVSPAEE